jgi:hypothetical protein
MLCDRNKAASRVRALEHEAMAAHRPPKRRPGLKRLAAALVLAVAAGLGGAMSSANAGELDLTTAGSFGVINGAVFVQDSSGPAGTGYIDSFLRIQSSGTEQGYNSNYRPFQYDEKNPINYTHAIRLADVPTITLNGVKYREFFLDVNESNKAGPKRLISLDQLVISSGTTDMLHDFHADPGDKMYHAGGTSTMLFDLDAGMDNWIKLNADLQQGSGHFDMIAVIPDAYFAAATGPWLYLYSQFGTHYATDAGFEEWTFGPGVDVPTPTPVPLPASAWGGMALLAAMGAKRWAKVRRQRRESLSI